MKTLSEKHVNLFMNIIYEKRYGNFISRILNKYKAKSFVRELRNCSPSFNLLWEMSLFIKIAEEVFFYDNKLHGSLGLYSSRNYSPGTNGFMIYDSENAFTLTVKLYSESKKAVLVVERDRGEKLKSSFTFVNNEWEDGENNPYNEMLLEQCIKTINGKFISLFMYCYELR